MRMKKNIRIIGIIVLGLFFLSAFPKHTQAQQGEVNFQVFYDQLSPYGDWVDYDNYGYVWIPDAGPDFVPYSTAGYWVFTDYGWTWVSDYKWGWAPFHYGRWDYNNYYGWFWVPDTEWGPSWVNWRESDGYYGWSPMQSGINISFNTGNDYDSHNDHWTFVRNRDFERPDINRYAVDRTDHERIIRASKVINTTYSDNKRNTTYFSGPARRDVQNVLGRKIKTVVIQENTGPGQNFKNGSLQIYRPPVVKNDKEGRKPAPWKVTNLNNAKRPMERLYPVQPDRNSPTENKIRIGQPNNRGVGNTKTERGWPEQPVKVKPSETRREQQPVNVVPQNRNTNPVQPAQKAQPSQPQPIAPAVNNRLGQHLQNGTPVQNSGNIKSGAVQPRTERPAVIRRQERQEKAKESKAAANPVEKPVNNGRKKQKEEN